MVWKISAINKKLYLADRFLHDRDTGLIWVNNPCLKRIQIQIKKLSVLQFIWYFSRNYRKNTVKEIFDKIGLVNIWRFCFWNLYFPDKTISVNTQRCFNVYKSSTTSCVYWDTYTKKLCGFDKTKLQVNDHHNKKMSDFLIFQ